MRRVLWIWILSSVVIFGLACSPSYKADADRAYKESKTADGFQKRELLKASYVNYQRYLKQKPKKISDITLNRFLEMILVRANMMLSEGNYQLDVIPLLIEDMDKYLYPQAPDSLKTKYADLLMMIADSNRVHDQFDSALAYIDKAVSVSPNPQLLAGRKDSMLSDYVNGYFEMAQTGLDQGVKNQDPKSLLRAEYYVKIALLYKPDLAGAAELQSQLYRKNLATYSAYKAVFDEKLNRQVNKYDILLAVTGRKPAKGGSAFDVNMYNYSYNPLRLKSEQFYIEDINGEKYQALAGSKVQPEILDQERETKLQLVFPSVKAEIKKLCYLYEKGDEKHYSEKNFF